MGFNGSYPAWSTGQHNELERSTMLCSWVNRLFRLGHVQVRELLVITRPGSWIEQDDKMVGTVGIEQTAA